jgi:hypothetical protein
MSDKKGLELSLTVLVLIILSILIFIGAVTLVWKFFAGAEDIKAGIDLQTEKQIDALLRGGNELVAIPVNTKSVSIGREAVYGVGIRNLGDERDFYVWLDFEDMYDRAGRRVGVAYDADYIAQYWLGAFQALGPVTIAKHQHEIIEARVRAVQMVAPDTPTPRNVIAAFNVCISDQLPETVGPCTLDTPTDLLYGKKIRQVYVETK